MEDFDFYCGSIKSDNMVRLMLNHVMTKNVQKLFSLKGKGKNKKRPFVLELKTLFECIIGILLDHTFYNWFDFIFFQFSLSEGEIS